MGSLSWVERGWNIELIDIVVSSLGRNADGECVLVEPHVGVIIRRTKNLRERSRYFPKTV